MKKSVFYILLFILIFTLFSCNKTADNKNTSAADTTTSSSEISTSENSPSESSPTENQPSAEHTHSYGKWTNTVEPTCKEQGKKERVCSCGSKETESIAVISHKYSNGVCSMCNQKDPNYFVPDYKTGEANTVGNEFSDSNYASQADWIYFADQYQIYKVKKDGTSLTNVYKVSSGTVQKINIVGDWIYFYCEGSTEAKSYIAKVRTDGSEFEKIVSSVYVGNLLVVKDTVFFTKYNYGSDDYSKNWYSLYSVSASGGTTKQVHDGAVISIVADSNYVYFLYENESAENFIYRMKPDGTKKALLLSKISTDIFDLDNYTNFITLKNSKLYFIVFDQWKNEYYIASISTSGGSYTTYDTCFLYPSNFLYVVGNKAYYFGEPCKYDVNGESFCETAGLVEYDMTNKSYTLVKEEYECFDFYFTSDLIIQENYNNETLVSLSVYNTKTGTTKVIKIK